ncbi:MBL fold metallo-hydrolase [Cellulomonas oligotrophica]|uniref:Metal-dependent hydrolase n=1 Tax=Cellulomonas oligotrophica TaxID=931536 RepID=A0A7Y9FIG0_9CELL|nr:MBL fold metallo-hydrolase [Cellulomonas oligotrophica]NYD87923.1 ribonuclease BN (tRNA processing enzyme) [Cellulomonas oligotrophica]GIG32869.1 metal-dependent hydrolase [Cellulomonas oligotrophica]
MRLVVVGCSGSFPGPDSAASSYLVQAEDADGRTWSVLLDLGNGALGPLQRYGDPAALDLVALSHLHADHVADMAVLGVLRRYRPQGPLPPLAVHGPEGTRDRLLELTGRDPATDTGEVFDVHAWQAGTPVRVGPLEVTPVPVLHPVPAFGLRVTGPSDADPARRVTLAYTGDTDACPGLDDLATGADLLLSEAAFVEGRDDAVRGVHLTGRRAGEAAARGRSGRLVVTHVPAWNDAEAAAAEARAVYDGPVVVATPGLVLAL